MSNETVNFNVGGRHFEVSRSLVGGHSETVLGKLVSDAWNDDTGKEVFIDRSGKIFEHVLEYLRYGSIELPTSIPRSMFDRELGYYGIPSFEGTIDKESLPKLIDSFTAPLVQAQKKHASFFLAHECFAQFNTNRLIEPYANLASVDLSDLDDSMFEHFDQKLLDTYLEKYFGLSAVKGAEDMIAHQRSVMVYLIGAPPPLATAPAPASGKRSCAPGTAFGVTAPASATGGFGAPAPATGVFGAPAPAMGGFGSPAPATGLFRASAPATGGFAPFGVPFQR